MIAITAALFHIWIVICIACSTRLEVFQCPERKNIIKGRRKQLNLDGFLANI